MIEARPRKLKELSFCTPVKLVDTSDSEANMGDELTLLLEVFNKIEKANLSVSTAGGKTKVKLETSSAPPTVSSATSSTPFPVFGKKNGLFGHFFTSFA